MGGNDQIASITALLLVPSIGFMLVVERLLKADVLAMVGKRSISDSGAGTARKCDDDVHPSRPVAERRLFRQERQRPPTCSDATERRRRRQNGWSPHRDSTE